MLRFAFSLPIALLVATSAMADCYGWKRATDFNRSEEHWQCFQCLERGHYPGPGKMNATYCVTEAKQNGMTVYIAGDIVFDDLDGPANSLCGCGPYVLD